MWHSVVLNVGFVEPLFFGCHDEDISIETCAAMATNKEQGAIMILQMKMKAVMMMIAALRECGADTFLLFVKIMMCMWIVWFGSALRKKSV